MKTDNKKNHSPNREFVSNLIGIFAIIVLIWGGTYGMKILSDMQYTPESPVIKCSDLTDEAKERILSNKDLCKDLYNGSWVLFRLTLGSWVSPPF